MSSKLPPDFGPGRPISEIGRPIPGKTGFAPECEPVDPVTNVFAQGEAVVILSAKSPEQRITLEEALYRGRAVAKMAAAGKPGADRVRRLEVAEQFRSACRLAAKARGWSERKIADHPIFREINSWLSESTRIMNK